MHVAAYFDKVVVGVAEVHRLHGSQRAVAIDWSRFDGYAVTL